jgi:hypothetical protein
MTVPPKACIEFTITQTYVFLLSESGEPPSIWLWSWGLDLEFMEKWEPELMVVLYIVIIRVTKTSGKERDVWAVGAGFRWRYKYINTSFSLFFFLRT